MCGARLYSVTAPITGESLGEFHEIEPRGDQVWYRFGDTGVIAENRVNAALITVELEEYPQVDPLSFEIPVFFMKPCNQQII